MPKINISLIDYEVPENAIIRFVNGLLIVNEEPVDFISNLNGTTPTLNVKANDGSIKSLTSDSVINCDDIQGNVTAGVSINCDDIRGNVTSGSTVNSDDISGNVTCHGTLNCNKIQGNVTKF